MLLSEARTRLFTLNHLSSLLSSASPRHLLSYSTSQNPNPTRLQSQHVSATKTPKQAISDATKFVKTVLFIPPGVDPEEVTDKMVLPGSNIVIGPYAGDAKVKEVEFVKSSARAKDCPRDERPEFAMLGRSNVGKSSLINALVRKKEVALTSKKPGFLIRDFLFNSILYWITYFRDFGSLMRMMVWLCREDSTY